MVLYGLGSPGPAGIEAYRRAVMIEYGNGQWAVGPLSGDRSIGRQSFSSEGAALAATLEVIRRDA